MSKKQGIKRGSPEHAARKASLAERKEWDYRFERQIGMSIDNQVLCCALGRMGFRAGDFFRLQEKVVEVNKEYAADFLEDSQADKKLVYAKFCFDRELNSYTPNCMHMDWEKRNDLSTRHTTGLRIGPADNIPEEVEAYAKEYAEWKAKNEIRAHKATQTRARKKAAERKNEE